MIRTQVQLTEAQMTALKSISARSDLSVAELVRRGIDHVIESELRPTVTERRQRARQHFSRFRSGIKDLGTRHDDHLAEALAEDLLR
jgi:hypothetical protein